MPHGAARISLQFNKKNVDREANSIHITHIYMTAHFPGLVQLCDKSISRLRRHAKL